MAEIKSKSRHYCYKEPGEQGRNLPQFAALGDERRRAAPVYRQQYDGILRQRHLLQTDAVSRTASVPRMLHSGFGLLIDSEPEETCGPQQRSHR